MTGRDEDGVLGRWARRKAEARKEAALEEAPAVEESAELVEPEVEPESEEEALELLRERDPELGERIAGIDIDKLEYEDDFSIFMNKKVPEILRRRALSKLWLLNPILANVDGLNDYDDDFTLATSALREFKSAYIPGKGYTFPEDEEVEEDEVGEGEEEDVVAEVEDEPVEDEAGEDEAEALVEVVAAEETERDSEPS